MTTIYFYPQTQTHSPIYYPAKATVCPAVKLSLKTEDVSAEIIQKLGNWLSATNLKHFFEDADRNFVPGADQGQIKAADDIAKKFDSLQILQMQIDHLKHGTLVGDLFMQNMGKLNGWLGRLEYILERKILRGASRPDFL